MRLSAIQTVKKLAALTAVVAAASAPAGAHVSLGRPNGGEVLQVGSTYEIQWTIVIAHGLQNWDLWYSTTGGAPWTPIVMDLAPGSAAVGSIHTYDWTVPADVSTTVQVRVRMDNAGMDYEDLSAGFLTITNDLGANYCVGAPNSVGRRGQISAIGSVSVADNDLTLVASEVPAGQIGIFFYGPAQVQLPLGNGFRCVGGPVQHLQTPLVTDANGMALRVLDLAAEPLSSDLSLPSTTLNFQLWHRDAGSTNLTNGISVQFE